MSRCIRRPTPSVPTLPPAKIAVPVMVAMMHMTANPKVMGKFPVHDGLRLVGWIATAVMAAAAIAMGVTAVV